MIWRRAATALLGKRLAQGVELRLRHAYPHPLRMLSAIAQPRAKTIRPDKDERILVVGIGTAALSFVQALRQAGYRHINLVARDGAFGGKCVNFGCMPSEFVFARMHEPLEERRRNLRVFVDGLREDVRRQIAALDIPVVQENVVSVEGKCLTLEDGRQMPFDRLVLATGGYYPTPERVPLNTTKQIPIDGVWDLPPGQKLVIYARDNVSALAMGEAAAVLGLLPTVLLAGVNPLAKLPSFQYYLRGVRARGVTVHDGARLIRVDQEGISYELGATITTLPYDQLLVLSRPHPRIPPIDGAPVNVYELDMGASSLPRRPDIALLGDAAGYFTAAEADVHARLLAEQWGAEQDFARMDLAVLTRMPFDLHGAQSLALLGAPWTYAMPAAQWKDLDFRVLGWSRIHAEEGKLWYLLNDSTRKIEGLQICHPRAAELISLGSALWDHPIEHPAWQMSMPHPCASEIFRVLAQQIVGAQGRLTGR